MSIVLNEYEWAEKAIEQNSLGAKPTETLNRVAKYFIHNKYSKKEARDKLNEFFISCAPEISPVLWANVLDKAIANATKKPLVIIDGIDISTTEIKKIESLSGRQLQRLAFVLLCISKYNGKVNGTTNAWVNIPDREIMKLANIKTSVKRQSEMFGRLRDAGLIRFSKKIDNLGVQVLFDDNSDVALTITDFRNIGYQYLAYEGISSLYMCEECGILESNGNQRTGRKRKYCPECAIKIKAQQDAEAVSRFRTRTSTKVIQ